VAITALFLSVFARWLLIALSQIGHVPNCGHWACPASTPVYASYLRSVRTAAYTAVLERQLASLITRTTCLRSMATVIVAAHLSHNQKYSQRAECSFDRSGLALSGSWLGWLTAKSLPSARCMKGSEHCGLAHFFTIWHSHSGWITADSERRRCLAFSVTVCERCCRRTK